MKSFYVVSALRSDSGALGSLKRLETEKEAIEHAKYVIGRRSIDGAQAMGFYILKVVATVAPEATPVKVTRLK